MVQHSVKERVYALSDTNDKYELARQILTHLGDNNFLVMTGSKALLMADRLRLRLKRNSSKANILEISGSCASDRYDMHFFYYVTPGVRRDKKKGLVEVEARLDTKCKLEDVPPERLQDFFEVVTGLYVTLNPRPSDLNGMMIIE